MTEPTFDSIFDDLIDVKEELQSFLVILDGLLPEASVLLVSEGGAVLDGARPLALAQPVREKRTTGPVAMRCILPTCRRC